MNDRQVNRITGALGAGLSISYLLYARGIEDSLLADAVGANGVPMGVGGVMLLASLALLGKSWVEPVGKQTSPKEAGLEPDLLNVDAAVAEEGTPLHAHAGSDHPHRMALGLLALLASYVALLPFLGYVLSIGLLVGSVAWLAGARQRNSVLICMLSAGPVLWLLFDWALEIRLPVGLWPMLLGS